MTEALGPLCKWNQRGGESRLGNQPGELGSSRVPLIPASLPGFLLPLLLGLQGAYNKLATGLKRAGMSMQGPTMGVQWACNVFTGGLQQACDGLAVGLQ